MSIHCLMISAKRTTFMFLLCMACFACSPPSDPQREVRLNLKAIIHEYHWYCDSKKQPPESSRDLMQYQNPHMYAPMNAEDNARCKEALTSGDYIVFWSFDIQASRTLNTTILAYHKDVPLKGGQVALADSTVKVMTPKEFADAPKAGELP